MRWCTSGITGCSRRGQWRRRRGWGWSWRWQRCSSRSRSCARRGWAMSADWYHSRANYSTNYWYGSRGQLEIAAVVDDLMERSGFRGPYVGAKEVVFYTRHHFFMDQDTVYSLWEQ